MLLCTEKLKMEKHFCTLNKTPTSLSAAKRFICSLRNASAFAFNSRCWRASSRCRRRSSCNCCFLETNNVKVRNEINFKRTTSQFYSWEHLTVRKSPKNRPQKAPWSLKIATRIPSKFQFIKIAHLKTTFYMIDHSFHGEIIIKQMRCANISVEKLAIISIFSSS